MLEAWEMASAAILTAYLLGSVPTGYWFGKLRGVDIRTVGSGNIGATNIQRTLGTSAAIMVLAVDVGKGFIAGYLLSWLTPYPHSDILRAICGAAAILGHTFTLFLNFKGGKGVATTYGVLFALAPWTTLAVLLVFLLLVALTRYVSIGSVASAVLFPLGVWLFHESGEHYAVLILSLGVGMMIFIRHWANLGRLLRGEESRLGQKVSLHKGNSA